MGKLIHTSRIALVRDKGPDRVARVEGVSEPIVFGVHGAISKIYGIEPVVERATTLDHMVAAVAA
jgi:hypothetical protein